jgi:hypothetical protein
MERTLSRWCCSAQRTARAVDTEEPVIGLSAAAPIPPIQPMSSRSPCGWTCFGLQKTRALGRRRVSRAHYIGGRRARLCLNPTTGTRRKGLACLRFSCVCACAQRGESDACHRNIEPGAPPLLRVPPGRPPPVSGDTRRQHAVWSNHCSGNCARQITRPVRVAAA